MNNDRVGYRFSPTDKELINFYLKNKILGKSWLFEDSISEINIYSYNPYSLPLLSKIKSNDVWYFFSPYKYTSPTQRVRRRTTPSGFWKPTGCDRTIKDKGGYGDEIGIVKTWVYHDRRGSNVVQTLWVMYEYRITCLPPDQRTYTICKIKYMGEDGDFPSVVGNEAGNFSSGDNELGTFSSVGSVVGNFPSGGNFSSDLSVVAESSCARATTLDKRQQKLLSKQPPVVDSNTVRAATFAKMYKLLQNLPSVEIQGKLN